MTAVSFLLARLEKRIYGLAMGLMTNKNPWQKWQTVKALASLDKNE
jgi:hypothetical protein